MREHWCSSRGFLSIKKGFCKCRILQTVDKALLLQGFAIVGAAFLI